MLHTTENAGEDLPLRRFHCNGENRLKPYDEFGSARFGGPEETRTLDLSDANRTLSQLSYRPIFMNFLWVNRVAPA